MEPKKFKRVVLKLSGEALAGEKGYGIDPAVVDSVAKQIKETVRNGLQVAVVVGGGNIWRGLSGSSRGMDRATADYMGCWRRSSILWRYRMRWSSVTSIPGCKPQSKCVKLQNHTYDGGQFATLRRGASLFLQQEPGILTFRRIPQRLFGQQKLKRMLF